MARGVASRVVRLRGPGSGPPVRRRGEPGPPNRPGGGRGARRPGGIGGRPSGLRDRGGRRGVRRRPGCRNGRRLGGRRGRGGGGPPGWDAGLPGPAATRGAGAARRWRTCWSAWGWTPWGRSLPCPPPTSWPASGPRGATPTAWPPGIDERSPERRPIPPDLAVSVAFDPPVERMDRAAFAARALAEALHGRLSGRGLACTRVVVEVETEHGERLDRRWRDEGVLGPGAVADRVRWQLEGWLHGPPAVRPTSGITRLVLVPDEVVPATGRQVGFWGGASAADERAARACTRVEGLLGPGSVRVPEWRGGRDPGECLALVPFDGWEGDGSDDPSRVVARSGRRTTVARGTTRPPAGRCPRRASRRRGVRRRRSTGDGRRAGGVVGTTAPVGAGLRSGRIGGHSGRGPGGGLGWAVAAARAVVGSGTPAAPCPPPGGDRRRDGPPGRAGGRPCGD